MSANEKLKQLIAESKLNQNEGESMSSEEMSRHFGEKHVPDAEIPNFNSAEDAEKWEKEQDESSDIYKIKARVVNAVGANLTPVGEILCNSYTHVMKAFYNFAESLNDIDKERLKELIRSQEGMPANVISASKVYQRPKSR
jgi:hypothetical protein